MTAARLLYVLSPAKTLDMARSAVSKCSEPALLADAHVLVRPSLSAVMLVSSWSCEPHPHSLLLSLPLQTAR